MSRALPVPSPSAGAVASPAPSIAESLVRAIFSRELPDILVDAVLPLPSTRPQRLYRVLASDGRVLLVVLPPLSTCRLLRHETTALQSEAAVVRCVRETFPTQAAAAAAADDGGGDDDKTVAIVPQQHPTEAERKLLDLMPVLLSHCHDPRDPSLSHSVFEPVCGIAIAHLPTPLAPLEEQQVQRQAGRFLRRLCALTSQSGNFGPVEGIVISASDPAPPASSAPAGAGDGWQRLLEADDAGMRTDSSQTWSEAFHLMLEDILRDAEDMAVMLAYSAIRGHFRHMGHLLDSVKTPRLVVVRGMTDENMTLSRAAVSGGTSMAAAAGSHVGHKAGLSSERDPPSSSTDKLSPPIAHDAAVGYVAGLDDWSGCVFGDPLFASVFSRDPPPPPAFLHAFNGTGETGGPDGGGDGMQWDGSVIEDIEHAGTRLLLYGVYHAVVSIVSGIYRPRRDSTARELGARKRLGEILRRLQDIEDALEKKRPALPDGAEPPAKKARLDEENVTGSEEAPR